jgi:hypothetical protein
MGTGRTWQRRTSTSVWLATAVAATGFQGCGQITRLRRFRGLKTLFTQIAALLDIARDLGVMHSCLSFMTDVAKHIISPNYIISILFVHATVHD